MKPIKLINMIYETFLLFVYERNCRLGNLSLN